MGHIEIFTDGACVSTSSPGPGGWGVFSRRLDDYLFERCGGSPVTTHQRMELMAVIEALLAFGPSIPVVIHAHSKYVMSGVTEWRLVWKTRDWKTSDRKPVKNVDLWQQLDQLIDDRQIDWRWVKGHTRNIGHERADALARQGMRDIVAQMAES